ncbi:MAG: NifU family protein [Candidatus Brocadiia bacterium]
MPLPGRNPKPPASPAQLKAFIEGELRPAIREDGGDIAFEGLEGDTVRVRMGALCSICPSGPRTAKHFVERRLRQCFSPRLVVEARFVKPYFLR